jgi:single-strand DNA-binding protein
MSEAQTVAAGGDETAADPEADRDASPGHPGDRNEVHLVGRLAAPVEARTLPSGSMIATFRLIVRRPPREPRPSGGRSPTIDVIDCVAWSEPLRSVVARCKAGDMIEVRGSLRRRFWRAPATASRCEVELVSAGRLGPAKPVEADRS